MGKISSFISNFKSKDAWRLFIMGLLFAPLLWMVANINMIVDPEGLIHRRIGHAGPEYQMARALIEGKTVRARNGADDRLLEKYFIERLPSSPEIVILGSSHSMWLGNNIFPDHTVINNSVARAVLPDYLGIFEGYVRRGLYPKRVICVLDPQLIGLPFISEKWLSIKNDTYSMLGQLGVPSKRINDPLIPEKWSYIFSFRYFQESIERLRNIHQLRGPIFFKDGSAIANIAIQFGGTRASEEKTINVFFDGVDERPLRLGSPETSANEPSDLVNDIDIQRLRQLKVDKGLEDVLEKFLMYLMGHHIRVTLCLLPVHPEVYKNFLEMGKKGGVFDIIGIERYYRGLAQKLNLEIIGSYDPGACGLDGNDFYDGHHVRNETIERIFKQRGSKFSIAGL